MDKYKRLGKNTLLVFVGNGGAKIISLIMLPFYTRWLSVEDYGMADLINVYVALLIGISTVCIAESVFVFPKGQSVEKQKSYFSTGLVFSFLALGITALLFKLATTIFIYNNISNSFAANARFVYFLLVSMFFQYYAQQFVRSIDKMKIYSTTGIVLTVCTALFSFIMIPLWGVFGYIFALIFANVLAALYSLFFSGAFKYFSFRSFKKSTCKEMVQYSVPLIPNSAMWWLVGALNRPMMEYHLDMYAVGIFGVANRLAGILSALFNIFSISWQNSVMEEFGKDDYSYFYNKMFRLIVAGLVFLFFIITIGSKLLVSILTTPNFYSAWQYIPVLTFGVVLSSISAITGSNFAAAKQSKYLFYSALWVIIISLTCNIILIPRFGIMGASAAVVISFSTMALSRIIYSWQYVKIKNIMHYLVMLIIGAAMILVVLIVKNVLLKIIFIVTIFSLFIILNYELKNDVKKIYGMIKKVEK